MAEENVLPTGRPGAGDSGAADEEMTLGIMAQSARRDLKRIKQKKRTGTNPEKLRARLEEFLADPATASALEKIHADPATVLVPQVNTRGRRHGSYSRADTRRENRSQENAAFLRFIWGGAKTQSPYGWLRKQKGIPVALCADAAPKWKRLRDRLAQAIESEWLLAESPGPRDVKRWQWVREGLSRSLELEDSPGDRRLLRRALAHAGRLAKK